MWEVPFARSAPNLTTVRRHDLWSFAVPKSLRCGIQWVSAPRLDICSAFRRVIAKTGDLVEQIGLCLLTLVIDFDDMVIKYACTFVTGRLSSVLVGEFIDILSMPCEVSNTPA